MNDSSCSHDRSPVITKSVIHPSVRGRTTPGGFSGEGPPGIGSRAPQPQRDLQEATWARATRPPYTLPTSISARRKSTSWMFIQKPQPSASTTSFFRLVSRNKESRNTFLTWMPFQTAAKPLPSRLNPRWDDWDTPATTTRNIVSTLVETPSGITPNTPKKVNGGTVLTFNGPRRQQEGAVTPQLSEGVSPSTYQR